MQRGDARESRAVEALRLSGVRVEHADHMWTVSVPVYENVLHAKYDGCHQGTGQTLKVAMRRCLLCCNCGETYHLRAGKGEKLLVLFRRTAPGGLGMTPMQKEKIHPELSIKLRNILTHMYRGKPRATFTLQKACGYKRAPMLLQRLHHLERRGLIEKTEKGWMRL